jgi:hypothetical protein
MSQQSLHLLVTSPLPASSFAAAISAVQIRTRLRGLEEVTTVASVQYTFDEEYVNLRTKLLIESSGMEETLRFIEQAEQLTRGWFETAGITVGEATLSLPNS